MRVQQVTLTTAQDWAPLDALRAMEPDGVLVFGAVSWFEQGGLHAALRERFPQARLLGCSTAGEISREGVHSNTCVVTALKFDRTRLRSVTLTVAAMQDSHSTGQSLGQALAAPDLQAVLIYGPGVAVNGSALVAGLSQGLGRIVPITGGLAGDDGAFVRTWVLGDEGVSDRQAVALGFYGSSLRLGHGSYGGWLPFGPARRVTGVDGNVLRELDGEPALTIYKRYLGDHAKDLPASGLLFPFLMEGAESSAQGLIRTILGVDEAQGSLTLAGDVPLGAQLRLMQASTDRLVDGAEHAAESAQSLDPAADSLAILVSCVGRKLVMGSRVDDEVEAVGDVLGPRPVLTGFYSNGEISPLGEAGACQLHNQTMTITTMGEALEI